MIEVVIWVVGLLLVALLLLTPVYEHRRRARMTEAEYRRRAAEQPSWLSMGAVALDQILRPQAKAGAEYQQDKQSGRVRNDQAEGEAGAPEG